MLTKYPFEVLQEGDLFYLTDCEDADFCCVLRSGNICWLETGERVPRETVTAWVCNGGDVYVDMEHRKTLAYWKGRAKDAEIFYKQHPCNASANAWAFAVKKVRQIESEVLR